MGYIDGEVVWCSTSEDGTRRIEVIQRPDGVCRYVEMVIEHDEYSGD